MFWKFQFSLAKESVLEGRICYLMLFVSIWFYLSVPAKTGTQWSVRHAMILSKAVIQYLDVLGSFEAPQSTRNEIGDQTNDSKSIQGKADDHGISFYAVLVDVCCRFCHASQPWVLIAPEHDMKIHEICKVKIKWRKLVESPGCAHPHVAKLLVLSTDKHPGPKKLSNTVWAADGGGAPPLPKILVWLLVHPCKMLRGWDWGFQWFLFLLTKWIRMFCNALFETCSRFWYWKMACFNGILLRCSNAFGFLRILRSHL